MAEVLQPDPGAAEGSEALAETPCWEAPEDAGPQVGSPRGREGWGPGGGAVGSVALSSR